MTSVGRTGRSHLLAPLEARSPTLFLVGGMLFVPAAVLVAVGIVAGQPLLEQPHLGGVLRPGGWTLATAGLLGLYPGLADRTRWSTRIGALFALFAVIGSATGVVVSFVAALAGIEPNGSAGLVGLVYLQAFLLGLVGTLVAFPAFGIAVLRTELLSRRIGLLLLIPPLIALVDVTTGGGAVKVLVKDTGLALAHLAIGWFLLTERSAPN